MTVADVMTPGVLSAFRDRYVLAAYPTGGVILDLQSGNYFRLNVVAQHICSALLSDTDPISRVGSELKVPRESAAAAVNEVVRTLAASSVRGVPQGSYHFHESDNGYVLQHEDRDVLLMDPELREIGLGTGFGGSEAQLELYLRSVAPKVLFQRGVTVLHASACIAAGKLVAFAGLSGAGKTTTAHAFRIAGAALVSEDLLVLDPNAPSPAAYLTSEASIREWARSLARTLTIEPQRKAPSTEVSGSLTGPSAPLSLIICLDPERRRGTDFEAESISEADALIEVMSHDFLGAREAHAWRRYFAAAQLLVSSVPIQRAWAPQGTPILAAGAGRYISRMTS